MNRLIILSCLFELFSCHEKNSTIGEITDFNGFFVKRISLYDDFTGTAYVDDYKYSIKYRIKENVLYIQSKSEAVFCESYKMVKHDEDYIYLYPVGCNSDNMELHILNIDFIDSIMDIK